MRRWGDKGKKMHWHIVFFFFLRRRSKPPSMTLLLVALYGARLSRKNPSCRPYSYSLPNANHQPTFDRPLTRSYTKKIIRPFYRHDPSTRHDPVAGHSFSGPGENEAPLQPSGCRALLVHFRDPGEAGVYMQSHGSFGLEVASLGLHAVAHGGHDARRVEGRRRTGARLGAHP